MPVTLYSQCYAKNRLAMLKNEKGKFLSAFERFGIAVIYLSSFKGGWTLGNDGIVNDATPRPCDSPDLAYVETVLDHVAANPSVFDASRVATYGYSQNGQFSAYAGTCFANRIYGIWQGEAGLSIVGKKNPKIPPKAPECSASSFKEYGSQCEKKKPCSAECQEEVAGCVAQGSGYTWERYADCVASASACGKGCAPTKPMLDLSETPISKLSGWGAIEDEVVVGRPATSKCENTAFGGSPSPSPPPTPSPPPPPTPSPSPPPTPSPTTTTTTTTTK